jgi:hypothetical protein
VIRVLGGGEEVRRTDSLRAEREEGPQSLTACPSVKRYCVENGTAFGNEKGKSDSKSVIFVNSSSF